jgi:FkbM family methyltransferase
MAIHAKKINRTDINFIAIEADKDKCNFIKEMAQLNNVKIKVLCYAIGKNNIKVNTKLTGKSGSVYYKESVEGLQMVSLDSLEQQLGKIGFIHVDIEGWESEMLLGSDKILKNNDPIIILECWCNEDSIKKGFSKNPEQDIVNIMKKYDKYVRMDDMS